jgi:hypothetical protein
MRIWFIAGTLGAAVFLLSNSGKEVAGGPPNPPGWFTDYAKAKAVARQSRKPLFVVFRCQP